jgi:oligopeptide/dipeptide ABC transporter ATP-binding protein
MLTPLLEVRDLQVHFPVKQGFFSKTRQVVRAVDGISFRVDAGETLGVVGESGCGKTTLGQAVIRLIEPTAGTEVFDGQTIQRRDPESIRHLRKGMQLIFQDPFASLNPRMRIDRILGEPMILNGIARGAEKDARVARLIEKVGLSPEQARRFPHEFSGGQRQRIGVARALALNPRLIIGDEPVSALDVSIQAQIINLLKDLQTELGLSFILIAHDLAVVEHLCNRIAVMYLGRFVETGTRAEIYQSPAHPYTKALLSAVPVADPRRKKNRILLAGEVPSPMNPPSGCRFHSRCPEARPICQQTDPPEVALSPTHHAACLLL